jgi:hypothetical protein
MLSYHCDKTNFHGNNSFKFQTYYQKTKQNNFLRRNETYHSSSVLFLAFAAGGFIIDSRIDAFAIGLVMGNHSRKTKIPTTLL